MQLTNKSEEYIARIKKIRHMASRHSDYIVERALKYYVGIKEHEDQFLTRRKQYRKFFHKLQIGKCTYCFVSLAEHEGTLDHKIPSSRGGSNQLTNISLVCNDCNVRKGDMTHDEFLEFISNKGDIIHMRREINSLQT